jgi:hypothetical protein
MKQRENQEAYLDHTYHQTERVESLRIGVQHLFPAVYHEISRKVRRQKKTEAKACDSHDLFFPNGRIKGHH